MMSVHKSVAGRRSRSAYLALLAAATFVVFLACTGDSQTAAIPADTSGNSRGEQLYVTNCQTCHGGATGGSMMDLPPPHNANGHTWHHPDCQLIETVLNGSGAMGEMMRKMMGADENTPRMPAFKGALNEEDVAAILGYVKTFWTEEQRRFQASATLQEC